jgi:hypothetical protein
MVEAALLVARDQIVADLGQRHRLAVAGEAAQHGGSHETGADPDDHVAAPFVEDLVDHRGHDPRREGRGGGNDQQADDSKDVGPAIFIAVLGEDAAQHRRDL